MAPPNPTWPFSSSTTSKGLKLSTEEILVAMANKPSCLVGVGLFCYAAYYIGKVDADYQVEKILKRYGMRYAGKEDGN